MKKCRKCKEEKPTTKEFFHSDRSKLDGLSSICKKCGIEQARIYKQKNKQILNRKSKEYYWSNRDEILSKRKTSKSKKRRNEYRRNKLMNDACFKRNNFS